MGYDNRGACVCGKPGEMKASVTKKMRRALLVCVAAGTMLMVAFSLAGCGSSTLGTWYYIGNDGKADTLTFEKNDIAYDEDGTNATWKEDGDTITIMSSWGGMTMKKGSDGTLTYIEKPERVFVKDEKKAQELFKGRVEDYKVKLAETLVGTWIYDRSYRSNGVVDEIVFSEDGTWSRPKANTTGTWEIRYTVGGLDEVDVVVFSSEGKEVAGSSDQDCPEVSSSCQSSGAPGVGVLCNDNFYFKQA